MVKTVAWMHYPIDDLDAHHLSSKVLQFHEKYEFEFIKVSTNSNSLCNEWGIHRPWKNSIYGSGFKNKRIYDPNKILKQYSHLNSVSDFKLLVQNIQVHQKISQLNTKDSYATVYSPFYHLKTILGNKLSIDDVFNYSDILDFLVKITSEYITELQKINNVKIYYCVFIADQTFCKMTTFRDSVFFYDKKCIQAIQNSGNLIHFHGASDFINNYLDLNTFKLFSSDTIQHSKVIHHILKQYPHLFFLGGLDRDAVDNCDALTQRLSQLKKLYHDLNFIIGPNCTLPITVKHDVLSLLSGYA